MNLVKSSTSWLYGLLFLASFTLASVMLPRLPLNGGQVATPIRIPVFNDPGDDAFFVSNGSRELSHIALWHGIGPSIEHARAADILILGNSRAQIGLSEETIVQEANRLGVKVFNLATGHAEKVRFALEVIRRHDLRPSVVIASGGPFQFSEGLSPWAMEVTAMHAWEARRRFFERSVSWAIATSLHHHLPKLDTLASGPRYPWVHYRSWATGWWRNVLEPAGRFPIAFQAERPDYRHTLPLANELRDELLARDALLVLTLVPYPRARTGHLPFLSRELAVPYILPLSQGLYTADGSHLDRDSARRVTEAFWQEFMALEAVRVKLSIE